MKTKIQPISFRFEPEFAELLKATADNVGLSQVELIEFLFLRYGEAALREHAKQQSHLTVKAAEAIKSYTIKSDSEKKRRAKDALG